VGGQDGDIGTRPTRPTRLNFSEDKSKPVTRMDEARNTKFYYALLSVGGVSSFSITAWGCLASLILDYRKPTELSLGRVAQVPAE
jgi:hypothetical protein